MRKYYIDNMRWITIVLVVIFHVIFMFNSVATDGVVGPITNVHGRDVIQYLLYPWFMAILFIISGMCAKYYLDNHIDKEFVKVRTRKLLVPSTIGLFVFEWLQGYINMQLSGAFDTFQDGIPSFVIYLIMVLSGIGVLWTIQMMWVFSIVLLLVRKLEKGRLYELGGKVNIIVLMLLGIVVWGAAQILNTPIIVVYHFGYYGSCFLLGYYVFSHDKVVDQLKKYCIPLLGTAVVLGCLYAYLYFGENYALEPTVNCPLAIAYGWTMCLAVIGCMKRWGDKTCSFTSFMSKKSFGLYVFHYLPLSATAYYLSRYINVAGAIVYVLVTIAAFVGGFLLFEIISRIPVIRWCVLGIKKEEKDV